MMRVDVASRIQAQADDGSEVRKRRSSLDRKSLVDPSALNILFSKLTVSSSRPLQFLGARIALHVLFCPLLSIRAEHKPHAAGRIQYPLSVKDTSKKSLARHLLSMHVSLNIERGVGTLQYRSAKLPRNHQS